LLFAEGGARIIVSVSREYQTDWETYLKLQLGAHWQKIGQVGGRSLRISTADHLWLIDATIAEMQRSWQDAIERRLED
jgi:hypothetical protein